MALHLRTPTPAGVHLIICMYHVDSRSRSRYKYIHTAILLYWHSFSDLFATSGMILLDPHGQLQSLTNIERSRRKDACFTLLLRVWSIATLVIEGFSSRTVFSSWHGLHVANGRMINGKAS